MAVKQCYSGSVTHPELHQELLQKIGRLNVACHESAPDICIQAELSSRSVTASPSTVITVPQNCDVKNAPVDFPKSIATFIRKLGPQVPDAANLKMQLREVNIMVNHLSNLMESVTVDTVDDLSSTLREAESSIQDHLVQCWKDPATKYIEMQEARYQKCQKLMAAVLKQVEVENASAAIIPSINVINTFLTRYYDPGALVETRKVLQSVLSSREKSMAKPDKDAPVISSGDQRVMEDMEREAAMIVDSLYGEISTRLPTVNEATTADVETTRDLSTLRRQTLAITATIDVLKVKLQATSQTLNTLLNRVQSQKHDIRSLLDKV